MLLLSIIATLGIVLASSNTLEAHTTASADDQTDVMDEKANALDTVMLKPQGRKRRMLNLNRETGGLKEHKTAYAKLAIISLVIVAIIAYFIFRKPRGKA